MEKSPDVVLELKQVRRASTFGGVPEWVLYPDNRGYSDDRIFVSYIWIK